MRRLRKDQDGPGEVEGPRRGCKKLCSHSLSSAWGCTCRCWVRPWPEPGVLQVRGWGVALLSVSGEGSGQADPRRSRCPPLCGFSQGMWELGVTRMGWRAQGAEVIGPCDPHHHPP